MTEIAIGQTVRVVMKRGACTFPEFSGVVASIDPISGSVQVRTDNPHRPRPHARTIAYCRPEEIRPLDTQADLFEAVS